MDKYTYIFESYENRLKEESEQGSAEISLVTAAEKDNISDNIVGASIQRGVKVKMNFAEKSYQMNKKHIHSISKVTHPLTDEIVETMSIDELRNNPIFQELYEELSGVVGDVSKLKEGLKKN